MRTVSLVLLVSGLLVACDDAADGGPPDESRRFTATETWDEVVDGAHWTLSYDPSKDVFVGTVENTTQDMLEAVRLEVFLSGGEKLGPSEPQDVEAGESASVSIEVVGEPFEWWAPHPRSGS